LTNTENHEKNINFLFPCLSQTQGAHLART